MLVLPAIEWLIQLPQLTVHFQINVWTCQGNFALLIPQFCKLWWPTIGVWRVPQQLSSFSRKDIMYWSALPEGKNTSHPVTGWCNFGHTNAVVACKCCQPCLCLTTKPESPRLSMNKCSYPWMASILVLCMEASSRFGCHRMTLDNSLIWNLHSIIIVQISWMCIIEGGLFSLFHISFRQSNEDFTTSWIW